MENMLFELMTERVSAIFHMVGERMYFYSCGGVIFSVFSLQSEIISSFYFRDYEKNVLKFFEKSEIFRAKHTYSKYLPFPHILSGIQIVRTCTKNTSTIKYTFHQITKILSSWINDKFFSIFNRKKRQKLNNIFSISRFP